MGVLKGMSVSPRPLHKLHSNQLTLLECQRQSLCQEKKLAKLTEDAVTIVITLYFGVGKTRQSSLTESFATFPEPCSMQSELKNISLKIPCESLKHFIILAKRRQGADKQLFSIFCRLIDAQRQGNPRIDGSVRRHCSKNASLSKKNVTGSFSKTLAKDYLTLWIKPC